MTVSRPYDVAIVGAGLVGLAIGRALLATRPMLSIAVLDKEPAVGQHQSGHNSGVLHSGLYYAPGSLKARLCREGKLELEQYAGERGIPVTRLGKLVVAATADELPRLNALMARAVSNGVPGIEQVGPERMAELEPAVSGVAAIWSPASAVVNFAAVADSMLADLKQGGVDVLLSRHVLGVRREPRSVLVQTDGGEIACRNLISAAGLWADRVAAMTGDTGEDRIVPFRGDYYELRPKARGLVKGLVYPVPDPRFPFLGVHFTRRFDGAVLAGPNAVLAFARDGYRRRDLDIAELISVLQYPGFIRLAAGYWRTGLGEMWRDVSKRAFLRSLQRYIPTLTDADLTPGPSGVRAQALDRSGHLVDDFKFGGEGRILHVRNAPSPGATSSLAIGRFVATRALEQFGA